MIRTLNAIHDETMPERDDEAGFGCLETPRGCLPLVAMDVSAKISGLLARTQVTQMFRNSLDDPLEATYIFPLPDRAAVTSFRMRVGDRVVEGQLKERGQARKDYRKAIEDGHRAALAEEDRSGTFSIQVGNIPPREDISVELTLVGPLPVSGGEATYRFPLVVAPRYTSGIPLDGSSVGLGQANDTDEVPDASRVTPPVLLPGFPNPVALSLEVELDPQGLMAGEDAAEGFGVSLHSVIVEEGPPSRIRLQPGERLNRDFILRFPVAADAVQTSLVASRDKGTRMETFALTLVPPAREANMQTPRDAVIVLDRSGSMNGWKMVAARRAAGRIIDSLLDDDRFSVIAFDDSIERPPHANGKLCPATDRNRWRAIEWLGKIDSRGGTEIAGAVSEAVRLLRASNGDRQPILVLVTDGQVTGEDAVLRTVERKSPGGRIPRIHAVGIDRAVNAGFLQRLADAGGGTCDLVESEDRLDVAMESIHRGIATAVVTDLRIEAISGSLVRDSSAPGKIPDLFADRPVTVFGRCNAKGSPLRLRISGTDASGARWQTEVKSGDGPADTIRSLWGRARVRDLEDRYAMGVSKPKKLAKEIVEVALETNVLSRFTAFVAVDKSEIVNEGGSLQQVIQPVEMPDGWEMGEGGVDLCCSLTDVSLPFGTSLPGRSGPAESCESLLQELDDVFAPPARPKRRGGAGSIPFKAEPERGSIKQVLAEIRKLTKPVKGGLMAVIRNQRTRLLRLAEMLQRLEVLAEGYPLETHVLIETAALNVKQTLSEYQHGKKSALNTASLNVLFNHVREILEEIEQSLLKEGQEEFWT